MAKAKKSTVFFCQECGFESAKWMGQCPGCKEWNTFVEEVIDRKSSVSTNVKKALEEVKPVPLSAVSSANEERTSTEIKELDRVLGGGIVKGSLVLVGVIRELVNLLYYYKFVRIFLIRIHLFYIYQVKNPCNRLKFVQKELEHLQIL